MLVYAGAERTGRWSGAGVQPQNFPRGMGAKTDEAFVALQAGGLEMIYDHPVEAITDMLRGFFTGPLLVGDYSQIEARTLAWLAGQQDLLDVFAAKQDPYAFMASRLYGRPITKDSTDDSLPPGITPRFMGKQVVLGCGYGMGAEKFQTMLSDVYDVDIEAATAMKTINIYRRANQSIVKWWGKLEEAAQEALRKPGTVTTAGRVTMETATIGGFLYLLVHLPSGRNLHYFEPELSGDSNIKYWGRNPYAGGKWDRISGYGGKFAENITQALSRDLMADAMLRLEDAGFRLLLTVHDEIVSEVTGLLSTFKDVMLSTPSWAAGLPVDAEVFQCARYRK